jgi:hypothetical protein
VILLEWHDRGQRRPTVPSNNLELPSHLPDSFPHSWDTHSKLGAVSAPFFRTHSRDPTSFIRNREDSLIRAALQANVRPLTSRMEVDVRQPFLHNPVQCQLDILGQSGEIGWHFQIDMDSGSLGISIHEPPQG